MSHHSGAVPPFKRQRRTATSVLAGDFDTRPSRDVLTSLLNGVPSYKVVEKDEEVRRTKRKERREREKEKTRAKPPAKPLEKPIAPVASTSNAISAPPATIKRSTPVPRVSTSSFWQARPNIHISTMQRSKSITPPPMPSSPPTTPGPSISSTTSATSSKRPHTPNDDEEIGVRQASTESATPPPPPPRPRKKRPAVRKGWKGWVEGSPPPSEKLINLDVVTVLSERKTRSGKNFDAIGVGKEGWV